MLRFVPCSTRCLSITTRKCLSVSLNGINNNNNNSNINQSNNNKPLPQKQHKRSLSCVLLTSPPSPMQSSPSPSPSIQSSPSPSPSIQSSPLHIHPYPHNQTCSISSSKHTRSLSMDANQQCSSLSITLTTTSITPLSSLSTISSLLSSLLSTSTSIPTSTSTSTSTSTCNYSTSSLGSSLLSSYSRQLYSSKAAEADIQAVKSILNTNGVVIFSKKNDPFSDRLKEFFGKHQVQFHLVEVEQNAKGEKLKQTLFHMSGVEVIPSVFIGGNHVGGCYETLHAFETGDLKKMLSDAKIELK